MHLTSQMQRFTHETKNIKSMIQNFKSEMKTTEMLRRSKSGVHLGGQQNVMQFSKKVEREVGRSNQNN